MFLACKGETQKVTKQAGQETALEGSPGPHKRVKTEADVQGDIDTPNNGQGTGELRPERTFYVSNKEVRYNQTVNTRLGQCIHKRIRKNKISII